jgi:ankyrin repeat protein
MATLTSIEYFYENFLKEKHNEGLINAENSEQTKLFLILGADVNAKDKYGETALRSAKTAEQTRLLIEAGADVNVTDKFGRTALTFANSVEQKNLLIEAGAVLGA